MEYIDRVYFIFIGRDGQLKRKLMQTYPCNTFLSYLYFKKMKNGREGIDLNTKNRFNKFARFFTIKWQYKDDIVLMHQEFSNPNF